MVDIAGIPILPMGVTCPPMPQKCPYSPQVLPFELFFDKFAVYVTGLPHKTGAFLLEDYEQRIYSAGLCVKVGCVAD